MKKFTLILAATLSLFGLQSQAQTNPTWEIIDTCKTTVTDQNTVFTVPSDDYLDISKAWIPSDSTSSKPKTKGDPVQFDNMRKGDFAVFHLNVTKAGKAQVNMQMATKESTAGVEFALFNANHELELDVMVNAANTGNWSKFADNYFITDNNITEGEKTLVVIFDGPKNTVNLRQIQWKEFANQSTYSFYPNIVSDDNNENAGTIAVSPSANSYIEGTTITVTATPADGYKFVNWTNADGDEVSKSQTYTFDIYEDTDLDANFKKLNMINSIPGFVDFDTKSGNGTVSTVVSGRNAPRFITDYENKENADTLNIKEGTPYLDNFRDGNSFSFQAKVDKQAKYYVSFLASAKSNPQEIVVDFLNEDNSTAESLTITVPATGQWFNYTKVQAVTATELPTTVNKVAVSFSKDDDKYAANIMNLSFTETEHDPTLDADGNSILEGGGTTGINAIHNLEFTIHNSGADYNLSGQRVSKDYKGIVIRNGKKYIIK